MRKAQNPMRRSWLSEEGGFLPHRLRLVLSPAWRHRPIPLCRILERLEIEHLRHGGNENGHLCVSYEQFVKHGVSKRAIRGAIEVGERLGLLKVDQSESWAGDIRAPNEYRLTYVPEKDRRAPTDEWATVTEPEALKAVEAYQRTLSGKLKAQYPKQQHTSAHSCTESPSAGAHSCTPPVPKRELPLISGGKAGNRTEAAPLVEEARPQQGGRHRNEQASGFVSVGEALAAPKVAGEGSH